MTQFSPAGYSGKPLSVKLGLKSDPRAAFLNAPEHLPKLLEDVWETVQHVQPDVADYRICLRPQLMMS